VFFNELTQGRLVKVLGLGPRWITYGVPFAPTTQRRVLWCKWQLYNSPSSRQLVGFFCCAQALKLLPPSLVPNLYHTKFPASSLLLAMPIEEERDYALVQDLGINCFWAQK
jgi:hypothetical protein